MFCVCYLLLQINNQNPSVQTGNDYYLCIKLKCNYKKEAESEKLIQ